MSTVVKLEKLRTPFYVPPHTGGDRDFDGHGPNVRASVSLRVSDDSRRLLAEVWMKAIETKSDWTRCEGKAEFVIFSCIAGQTIEALNSSTTQEVAYTDGDWEADFVVDGVGERKPTSSWNLPDAPESGLARFYRFIGDTNGEDAGKTTGVQVYFNPISVTLKGTAIDVVKLDVPTGVGTCGENTCASSASASLLQRYGKDVSCSTMKKLIEASPNFINMLHHITGKNLGIDPSSLRDRMNEVSNEFHLHTINDSTVMDFIHDKIADGIPVLALTGWGSKTIQDWYCKGDDVVGLNGATLHYVVVDGYNRQTDAFRLVDNGSRKYVHSSYLRNVILWEPEWVIKNILEANNVSPGKVICSHKKPG